MVRVDEREEEERLEVLSGSGSGIEIAETEAKEWHGKERRKEDKKRKGRGCEASCRSVCVNSKHYSAKNAIRLS